MIFIFCADLRNSQKTVIIITKISKALAEKVTMRVSSFDLIPCLDYTIIHDLIQRILCFITCPIDIYFQDTISMKRRSGRRVYTMRIHPSALTLRQPSRSKRKPFRMERLRI